MTSVDLNGLLARFCAVEAEYFATLIPTQGVDCKPYFYHFQESYPYFIHRVAPITQNAGTDEEFNEDFYVFRYEIEARLIIGHIDQGYFGVSETNLYTWIPGLITYFNQRRWMQSVLYSTKLNKLMSAELEQAASPGWTAFQDGGVPGLRVGTRFLFTCEFNETIDQAYN